MKTATFALLLLICGAVLHAQTSAASSSNVTIELSEGPPEYCRDIRSPLSQLGRSPGDITLRLQVALRYKNLLSETIFLPRGYNFLWRMAVAGQGGPTILRNGGGGAHGLDVKSLMARSHPEGGPFWIVAGGKDASSTLPKLSVLKFKDTVDDNDFVMIPVVDRASGLDLRGKSVQIVTARDFQSSIAPDVVQKLNEKWKDYGTVWARVVESAPLTLQIPQEPQTRDCLKPPIQAPR